MVSTIYCNHQFLAFIDKDASGNFFCVADLLCRQRNVTVIFLRNTDVGNKCIGSAEMICSVTHFEDAKYKLFLEDEHLLQWRQNRAFGDES